MPLTRIDLEKIRQLFKAEIELIDIRIERLENNLNNFKLENKQEHREILKQLRQLKDAENEDVQAISNDLLKIEKRVVRLEAKSA